MKYEQVNEFKLSWKIIIILNFIAGAVFIAGFYLFFYLYLNYSNDLYGERLFKHSDMWVSYGLVFIQVVLHEYSHGIGYKLCGGKVAYGIKWLCPYCREVSGLYYPTRSFITTLILPLLTGTIIGILAIILFPQFLYYIVICMLVNVSGAAGDIMMFFYILSKTRKEEFIKDEPYGFSVHRKTAV